MAKHNRKHKTKVIYRNSPAPKEEDLTPKLKEEIKALQEQKAQQQKGFKGFLTKARINKAIYDKNQYIRAKEGSRNLKEATTNLSAKIEFEKKKNELAEIRKKNEVNFGSIFGSTPQTQRKALKFEDLI
jgi:hypothetical protein